MVCADNAKMPTSWFLSFSFVFRFGRHCFVQVTKAQVMFSFPYQRTSVTCTVIQSFIQRQRVKTSTYHSRPQGLLFVN